MTIMRMAMLVAVALFTTGGLTAAERAQAATTHYELNIPRQPLDTALKDLAQQTGLQVARFSDAVNGDTVVGPVTGDYSADQALKTLLAPTNLTYRSLNDHAIIVLRPEDVAQVPAAKTLSEDKSESLWSRLRLAQGSNQANSSVSNSPSSNFQQKSATSSQANSEPVRLEELIVTAQKREERLQDVPVPISVISGETLIDNNQLMLKDLNGSVPGLVLTPGIESGQTLTIRGISAGTYTTPTVGIAVDDVPYGTSTGQVLPDFDPGDIARVEVLRGPQGTLYGADSMGGLLKYVTVDPSTAGLSGSLQAGTSSVYNGAELGYNFRASVNVPLNETLAIRMSGFSRQDPGYIDDILTGQRGVNEAETNGGRLSALWKPLEGFSLKLSALYQRTIAGADSLVYVEPGLGDLQQNVVRGSEAFDRSIQAFSAILKAQLGSIDLTSITGYNVTDNKYAFDFSYGLGAVTSAAYGVGGSQVGAVVFGYNKTDKVTQEIRLAGTGGQQLDWVVGAFYTHENNPIAGNYYTIDGVIPTTGQIVALGTYNVSASLYEEYAAFADLTYKVTDRLDVQLGGRESRNNQIIPQSISTAPLFGAPAPVISPELRSNADVFTYLLTPKFRLSSDFMVYARLASGYRPGGPNTPVVGLVPAQFNADTTKNYELGVKGDFLDHLLTIDASLYYIEWKDIQLHLDDKDNFPYTGNGSGAKSDGMELSLQSKPLTGLTIAAWVTISNAELTQAFPANGVYGQPGNRLPYSSRIAANISLDQDFPLSDSVTGSVGGWVSYLGDRLGDFTASAQRSEYPAYTQANLRAAVRYGSWKANIFVTNVADARGVIGGGLGDFPPFGFQYIQPRTVGVNFAKNF